MTFGATVEVETTITQVVLKPPTGPLHSLDKIVVNGTIDPKAFLTGIFIECIAPNGNLVLADVVDVNPNGSAFSDEFVLGGNANWTTGTFTFKLFWNPNDGPGIPEVTSATFQYQA